LRQSGFEEFSRAKFIERAEPEAGPEKDGSFADPSR
jgi:hypothetical protein